MSFLVAFAIGLVLMPVARRVGLALRLVDAPVHRLKIHRFPIPILGGPAVVVSVFMALAALGRLPPVLELGAVALAVALGFVDDLRSLPVWARALVQAASGLLLVAGGLALEPLGALGGIGVVFVAVACPNAVNMVDGQDGLAGGLAALAALGLASVGIQAGGAVYPGLGMGLAGALAAFLLWNRPPARLFLGNGGTYGIGLILAVLAARVTSAGGWPGLLASGLCLGVFIFELTFSVARRMLAGERLTGSDRSHTYDLLARSPSARPRVTLLLWGVGLAAAGLGQVVIRVPLPVGALVTGLAGLVALGSGLYVWLGTRGLGRAPKSPVPSSLRRAPEEST